MVLFFILMAIRIPSLLSTDTSPKKVYTVSCGFLKHDEKDQVSDSGMEAKDAKWKSIAGLALMNVYDPEKQSTKFDDLVLVADTALQCIKCVRNISCLWRSPRETFFLPA